MRHSLKRKLILAFLGLAILPLVLAGTALLATTYRLQSQQTLMMQRQLARGLSAEFRNYVGDLIQEVEGPLRRHGLAGLGGPGHQSLAASLLGFGPMFIDLMVLDPDGAILSSAHRYGTAIKVSGTSQAHLPEIAGALLSRTATLGAVRYDSATNEPIIGIAVPAQSPRTGEVEGILLAHARFHRIWDLTMARPDMIHITAYVVDQQGHVVAHPNPSVVLANTTVLPAGGDGIGWSLDGSAAFVVREPVMIGNSRFVVTVEQPLLTALRLPLGTAGIVFIVLLFSGMGALVLMRHSRRVILEPIEQLAEAVRGVEAGDLSRRSPVAGGGEIGALSDAFNSMTARIETLLTTISETEEKFRLVSESTSDAMVVIDENGIIVSWNRGAMIMFGYQTREIVGRNVDVLMPESLRMPHRGVLAGLRSSGGAIAHGPPREQAAMRKDGSLFPSEVALASFIFQGRRYYSSILRDISARKQAESNIRFLARHDPLTGLANRIVLQEKLDEALAKIALGGFLCLLFIDLDNFKLVNDTLGHTFGDKLLRAVADRLRLIDGGGNTICRHGGDEFILLAPDLADRDEAAALAQQILVQLSEPFAIDAQMVEVGCSIGITIGPDDGADAETLIRKADIAMYRAKDRGRLNYQLFTPAMGDHLAERRRLEDRLRRALRAEEISVHLQPKVAIDTGEVVGFEALARWDSPELGMVPPTLFIPVAEETGLIAAIGQEVLRQVLEALTHWRSQGLRLIPIAINLSSAQLRNATLATDIETMLRDYDISSDLIEMELTESMLMGDGDEVLVILNRLNDLGIKLSIDDFGTGYSSLSYLRRFPLKVLKIDRSFVSDLPGDREGAAICLAIINMAKALSLEVVAEGVETEAQYGFLREHGCDFAQGYLISRPVPMGEATRYLFGSKVFQDPV